MKEKNKNYFKAAINSLIVAFLFVLIICIIVKIVFGRKIDAAISTISIFTVTEANTENLTPVLKDGILTNYPLYGSKYATLKIESINLDLPVYYGASYSILKNGVAHDDKSYFPGEGGSIVLAGHNFKNYLASLPNVKEGDVIELETTYGNFKYEVYDSKIVDETDLDSVPIQKDEEILMIYTCWPINNIGHASQRYVVYSKIVNE